MSHPASLGTSSVTTASYQPGADNPASLADSSAGQHASPEEVEAAIKIQKVVRGHLSRRNSEKLRSGFNSAAASPSHSRTPSTSATSPAPTAGQPAKPATAAASNSASSPLSSVTGAAQSAWQYVTQLPPTALAIAGVAVASVAYVLFVANKPNQFTATVTTRRP